MTERSGTNSRHADLRVAEILGQVRAGVRQRQAELATLDSELRDLPPTLARVQDLQYIEEPDCVSHRPIVGRVIVLAKKFVYQAFMKWFMSSLIEQQNAFNRASTQALRDLFERQRDLAKETRRLAAAVEREASKAPDAS
ncbi:MAG: hypothetical protein O7A98_06185 [Acidobacteria bacterium]|nr:hypothetical protein [Acidobacteriota bacterium]